MEMSQLYMYLQRLRSSLTGHRPTLRSHGCAALIGTEMEGGYVDIKSPDLPGFRYMLSPEESGDMGKIADLLTPALNVYLLAYLAAQDHQQTLTARISETRLARHRRPLNMVAELC